MSALTREARNGLMRAWLELLSERHPGVTWIAADADRMTSEEQSNEREVSTT